MNTHEAELEQELLRLGQQELELESRMAILRRRAKDAGMEHRFEESDLAWELFERARETLNNLQSEIV